MSYRFSAIQIIPAVTAVLLFVFVLQAISIKIAFLLLIGVLLGFALLAGEVSFAGGWRSLIIRRNGDALKSQLLMIGLGSLIFFPLLSAGELFGVPLKGAIAPLSVSLPVGAFLFGIGMQLGGGCGSGTLFTAAGGNPRMILVLVFFIAGSFLGSLHLPFWLALPGINPVVIYKHAGIIGGWLVQLFLIATVLYGIVKYESSAESTPAKKAQKWYQSIQIKSKKLTAAVIALVLLNTIVLLLSGFPWGITAGFTLWGGKIAQALGFPLEGYPYWQWENNSYALQMPLISDVTSVLNIGIIIGATTAALVIGNFGKNLTAVGLKSALAAVIGGLVMGYGARLSFGCNIGAFFSGTVSGSIHGWVWFLAAFAGTFPGIKLRAAFGLKL